MTNPLTERLRLAGSVTGGSKPQVAMAMANSDLPEGEMQRVGGFVSALDDAKLVRLARIAGAKVELNADQQSRLDGIGENYSDVQDGAEPDARNWLEKVTEGFANAVSNTGSWLMDNPVTGVVLKGFDFLNDVAHLPVRMLSSGLDTSNDNEVDAAMTAKGYDTGSAWDYVQFMTMQGDSLYHDLDGIRQQATDDRLVDLAIEMNADPEGFAARLAKKPADVQDLANSDEFKKIADLVDRQHISPGRDVARLLTFGNTDNAAFTAISGVLDATYTIMADPTLVLGKVSALARAADATGEIAAHGLTRFGVSLPLAKAYNAARGGRQATRIRDALDTDGIKALYSRDGVVRKSAQAFLDDADKLRSTTDEAERGAIFARMNTVHKAYMPFLDEVGGTRVLEHKFTDVESARQLREDLLTSPGVADAQVDKDWFDSGLNILRKKKVAESPEARQSWLRVVELQTGRKLNIPEEIVADATKGSRQRFENAAREALDAAPVVPTMPVPVGASFDRKLIDAQGIGWMATKGKEITDVDEFAQYLANTAGFLRLAHGAAAKRELLLPGRVSLSARLIGANAARRAQKGGLIFDHTKPYRHMPNEAEEAIQRQLDDGSLTIGDLMYNMRTTGTADGEGYNLIRKSRAKWEQRARRVSSLAPSVARINLTSTDGVEQVRRLARMYLPKAEADRLAGLYAVSDLGRRREILMGAVEQQFHASGLSRTPAGLAEIEKFRADQLGLNKRAYGLNRTDVIQTDAGERHVALLPSQLSDEVLIPDFKSLQHLASKYVAGGFIAKTTGAIRAGLTSDGLDQVSHAIKTGWITSAAGGTRNALDEVAGVTLTGGLSSLLHGRALFSRATEDTRTASLAARKRARALEGKYGPSIPIALRGMSNSINDVFFAKALGKLMMFKRGEEITDIEAGYAKKFAEAVESGEVNESLTGTYFADDAARIMGNDGVIEAAQEGIASAPVRFNGDNVRHEFDGYRQVPIDGGVGLQGFVNNLGMAFQDMTSPAHVALRGLTEDGRDVLSDVVEYMQTDAMRHFRENAEMFKWKRDGSPVVTADDELEAIERYSENLIGHVAMLVSGRGTQIAEADEVAGAAARWENDAQNLGQTIADELRARREAAARPKTIIGWKQVEREGAPKTGAEHEAADSTTWNRAMQSAEENYVEAHGLDLSADMLRDEEWDQIRSEARDYIDTGLVATSEDDLFRHEPIFDQGWNGDPGDPAFEGLGPINTELLDMLKKGIIPDRAWVMDNMATEELPLHTVQKTWLPVNPKHAPGQLAQGYTSLLTKAYNKVVTDQVNAISRNPMLTAAYVQARKNIASYEQHLKDVGGFTDEIAESMAHRMALRQAESSVIRMVDNPTVSTQYSILARNFHAFARAQEDWLRRWGRIIKDDPEVIRKAQLAIHGAESAGLVEKDDQGDLIFTYPGSGMVLNLFNRVSGIFGVDHMSVPMMPDLTSKLMFLNPSLDNPLGFSAMPVVSIPFKAISAVTGPHLPLLTASMDKVINGELGAGRKWYEMMLPGFVNRIMSGVLSDEDPASQFASAYTSALMNLAAAGRIDELDKNDATAMARFQNDLMSQVTNQMVARALFGFFAPAAPGMPTNDVQKKNGDWVLQPDFVYHKQGIKSLKDEARKIFSTMPYEQALEYWTKHHPGELIYAQGEVARTTVGTEDAQAFATVNAAKWMQDNPYLLEKYGGKGGIAAFFIPQGTAGTPGGEFSQVAYRAQLEQGIREHKSLDQFFNEIVIQRGEAQYYDSRDDYKDAINVAKANGDLLRVKQLEDEWSQQAELIKAANPLMAAKFAQFATSGVQRQQQLNQLNHLLGDQEAVKALGPQVAGVAQLMLAQREYEASRQAILGKRGPRATAERADINQKYEAAVASVVAQYPGLGDLARGVFRVPN